MIHTFIMNRMTERHRRRADGKQQDYPMKCQLCEAVSTRISKPSTWSEQNREWLRRVHKHSVSDDTPVCRACEVFIKRNAGKENIVPRWVKKKKQLHYCMVQDCGEISHTTTQIITHEIAQEYLDLIEVGTDLPLQGLRLCNSHYQYLYREIHTPKPCATCSSQPKHGEKYTRRCPDPDVISQFLKRTTNFEGDLTPESRICKHCYSFHREILLDLQQESECTKNDDQTLPAIIGSLQDKITHFQKGKYI